MAKRRHATPLSGPGAKAGKLTEQDRADIRQRYEAGQKQKDIAAQFGVSRPYVSTIVKGCTSRRPLSAHRERVEAMIRDGFSDAEIAMAFQLIKPSVGGFQRTAVTREKFGC